MQFVLSELMWLVELASRSSRIYRRVISGSWIVCEDIWDMSDARFILSVLVWDRDNAWEYLGVRLMCDSSFQWPSGSSYSLQVGDFEIRVKM